MLVHSTGQGLTHVDFPGYDNAEKKGWDGRVDADTATPWIPLGKSGWELGTNADPKHKADGDYAARVAAIRRTNGPRRNRLLANGSPCGRTTRATWSSGWSNPSRHKGGWPSRWDRRTQEHTLWMSSGTDGHPLPNQNLPSSCLHLRSSATSDEGAGAVCANPLIPLVAGARFELWKRTLTFEFFVTY